MDKRLKAKWVTRAAQSILLYSTDEMIRAKLFAKGFSPSDINEIVAAADGRVPSA